MTASVAAGWFVSELLGKTAKGEYSKFEPYHEKTYFFASAKTKAQISCTVTAQLISAFVFVT